MGVEVASQKADDLADDVANDGLGTIGGVTDLQVTFFLEVE